MPEMIENTPQTLQIRSLEYDGIRNNYSANYPRQSGHTLIDDILFIRPETIAAVKQFKQSNPFSKNPDGIRKNEENFKKLIKTLVLVMIRTSS